MPSQSRRLKLARVDALAAVLACCSVAACQSPLQSGPEPAESVAVTSQELVLGPLTPSADTTLRSGVPFGNDGTGVTLGITSASVADVKRSLIKFSQTQIQAAIPAGQVLYSARLDLTIAGVSAGWLGGAVDILPMTMAWPEGNGLLGHGPSWVCADDTNTTLLGNLTNNCSTANNWSMSPTGPYPQPFATLATDRVPIFTGGLGTISFDVTSDVQRFLYAPGTVNNGWMLAGASNPLGGEWVNFGSRESAQKPALILETGADLCPNNPLKGTPGQCGCDTPDTDTNLDNVPDCFDAVANATADTTLRLAVPFGNDGTGTTLGVSSASIVDLQRALVKVDNDAIEAARGGRKVQKAYLELTVSGIALGWAGGVIDLSRMNRDWAEGNGLLGHGASWFCADDTNTTLLGNLTNDCTVANTWGMQLINPWPCPFDATPTASTGLVWPGMTTVRFDVTSDIQTYLADETKNHGWMHQGGASNLLSGSWVNFGSRESGAPPRLLLTLDKFVDMEACADSVKPRADLTGVARERAYQAELQRRCIDPNASACLNDLRGRVNLDYTAAALAISSQAKSPAEFLAVDRDRERKARMFESDATRATALCAGDADGDLIPDGIDACPATPQLTPTNDVGCTDSTLPPAPPADKIHAILDRMGFAFSPACSGAGLFPKEPHADLHYRSDPKLQEGVWIFAGKVMNQPVGCSVWYVFDVEELKVSTNPAATPQGFEVTQRYRVAFNESEAETAVIGQPLAVPYGVIQFHARPTEPGTRGQLGHLGINLATGASNRVRFRLKVMNGAGMQSDWSRWKLTENSDCAPLGIYCN